MKTQLAIFEAQREKRSAALIIVLFAVLLLSIVIGALLVGTSLQNSVSSRDYQSQGARIMVAEGLDNAIAQIRLALGPWDDPFNNFCGGSASSAPPTFYWSVSPGIITRWSYSSLTPATNYPLFSLANNGDTNLANLNAPTSSGIYPIIGGANPSPLQVHWANVLQNPSLSASKVNPIIGRYAFWVDDESSKININTADGTMKYQTNSLGLGSPSEVSLQALQQGGVNLSTTQASNIVYIARTKGFESPQEILRASGATLDLYTNNTFNLTVSSRSPDLNVFGQPKMAMLPGLGDGDSSVPGYQDFPGTNVVLNGITLRPLTEIYPTPSQLPQYTWNSPFYGYSISNPWPLLFRQSWGLWTTGSPFGGIGTNDCNNFYSWPNNFYNNAALLSTYIAGTNAMGKPITWPAFPGTTAPAAGFIGKYTPRQIDCIVAELISLGCKDISPDIPFSTLPYGSWPSNDMNSRGRRAATLPFLLTGYLSKQWVSGMGRTPKVSSLMLEYSTYGSVGPLSGVTNNTYTPPSMKMDIWLEWWLPAAYLGGRSLLPIHDQPIFLGSTYTSGLNLVDQSSYEGSPYQMPYNQFGLTNYPDVETNATVVDNSTVPPTTNWNPYYGSFVPPRYTWFPASLPKANYNSASYWSDQLLTNNQGIDFQSIPPDRIDPDQVKAAQYHDPFAWTNLGGIYPYYTYPGTFAPYAGKSGAYKGMGGAYFSVFSTPFHMGVLQGSSPPQDWAPGELRCMRSYLGSQQYLDMQTSADGGTLQMGGGIAVRAMTWGGGNFFSEVDPVPLDTLRGNPSGVTNAYTPTMVSYDSGAMGYHWDEEHWDLNAGLPSDPTMTVRDLQIAAVIPAAASVEIPPNDSDGSGASYTKWVLSRVADPLVNKFPGDWITTNSDTAPATTMEYDANPNGVNIRGEPEAITYSSYDEYSSGFHSALGATVNGIQGDPDSYWLPQADVAISYMGDVASQTLIPRSARMPNIGYLQYLRTGIIPDDEVTTPYKQQHGTPFRLLSFAPSTETANQKTTRPASSLYALSQPYPDWALLDLMYVPSLLAPYGGPYGYHETNGVWNGYGNPNTLAYYSTGGGSTPGRVNPNGSVIYTTNTSLPLPGVSRLLPLEAVLTNLIVNQSLNANSLETTNATFNPNPGFSGGTAVNASSIAQAIQNYITNTAVNGQPLRMPAEIANVPEIAALRPAVNATRNDLVRQIVGALTTQSNVFSVWSVGQTIKKSPSNGNYGQFESGDIVQAESRFHYVVERYVDPGADGVYGNSANTGADGVVGTYDDPVDPVNHPYCPHYLYRVIAAEEVR